MKKDLTLVIMAAGMGSRFGGLKQIEPVGPNGEFIIDYSVYDAIKAGFNKVVFIIKEENLELFKNTVGSRLESKIKVEYVFQTLKDIPEGFNVPETRVKPLGTGHALRSARHTVKEPFVVISADDFYGSDTFVRAAEFLQNECDENTYLSVAYKVLSTVSENGSVNRGIMICENGNLSRIVESSVEKEGHCYVARPLNGEMVIPVNSDTRVSMITFAFHPSFFEILDEDFIDFLNDNRDNLETCEFYIPNVVQKQIDNDLKRVLVVDTNGTWHGMTHRDDLEILKIAIKQYHDDDIYPDLLS